MDAAAHAQNTQPPTPRPTPAARRASLDRVRELAAEGETELAAIVAIRAIASPGLQAPRPAARREERAQLLNDLAVLRFDRGDHLSAQACLRAAQAVAPHDPLVSENLAGVSDFCAAAEPFRSAHADQPTGPTQLNHWVREAVDVGERLVGLRERRVVEVGGALPREAVAATGAASWVSCDPSAEPGPDVLPADARALPLPDAAVDVVFSSCAFEHLHELPQAMREMFRVLAPGGAVFSQYAPIWSSALGHHLFLQETSRGRLGFNDPLLPHWAHLLLEPYELRHFLEVALGRADADAAVAFIWSHAYLSRVPEAGFREAFLAAGFRVERYEPWGTPIELTPGLAAELRARHPDAGDFDVPGLRVVLRRPPSF